MWLRHNVINRMYPFAAQGKQETNPLPALLQHPTVSSSTRPWRQIMAASPLLASVATTLQYVETSRVRDSTSLNAHQSLRQCVPRAGTRIRHGYQTGPVLVRHPRKQPMDAVTGTSSSPPHRRPEKLTIDSDSLHIRRPQTSGIVRDTSLPLPG
jgi:hypothetical protein